MAANPLPVAALIAAGLVVLSGAHSLRQGWAREAAGTTGAAEMPEVARNGAASTACAIYHARFGGSRSHLVKVMRGDIANFVVIEISKGNRVVPSVQRAWLRGAYGEVEPVWLGEFATPESALARAVRLCPDGSRCRRGEPNCGPDERPFVVAPGQ